MRLGSHKIPLRVVIAGISLVGLGVAAALPTVANETLLDRGAGSGVDPIITSSLDKVDGQAPTQTQLPAQTQASPGEGTLRQILPQAPEAVLATSIEPQPTGTQSVPMLADDTMASAPMAGDIAMSDSTMASMQDAPMVSSVGTTTSLAGDASDAGGIILALDHARVMRVVGDVTTIIIGNPAIADASMPDPGTIVLTGKSYGETNMVMLDANGDILAEQMLRVTVRGQSLVSVYRGVQRTTLSCSPTCEIRPTPGDSPDMVAAGLSAFSARNQAALDAIRGNE
ncbi:MAG: pilus assembly protein N-terminal domain-containing protein [Devosiaceae bacterium]